jgi:hypothetical protein
MTTLRGHEIKIEREEGIPIERASAVFTALMRDGGPGHTIRLDVWGDGGLELSLWLAEDRAQALWEGKIHVYGLRVEVETREATPTDSGVILMSPPPSQEQQTEVLAAELREVIDAAIPVETDEERAARHKLNEPLIAEFRRLREGMTADPLAAFRALEPGAPLYDRASGRAVGEFRRVAGDCVLLRSVITGGTTWSSGRALTTTAPTGPGDCRP